MNQIWFGLIWINPKESKTQRNKKKKKPNNTNKKNTVFQTSLNMPKSKQSPKLFFGVFVLVYHSKLYFH